MRKHGHNKAAKALLVFITFILISNFQISPATADYIDVDLGTAGTFSILAGTAITNGAGATVVGDGSLSAGIAPIVAIPDLIASVLESGSTVFENNSPAAIKAQEDLITAIEFMDALPVNTVIAVITNTTLTPGVYSSAADAAISISGIVTLDGQNKEQAVFIIRSGAALNIAGATAIRLINGAQSSNVYWVAGSELGVGGASTVYGNLISRSALNIGEGSKIQGALLTARALTIEATVAITHVLVVKTDVTPPIYRAPRPTVESPVPEVIIVTTPIAIIPEDMAIPTPVAPPILILQPPKVLRVVVEEPSPTFQTALVIVALDPPLTTNTVQGSSLISRASFAKYFPANNPKETTDTVIAAFATLSVISASAGILGGAKSKQMGFLAQVGRGGAIAAGIATGRGDRRRERRTKNPGKLINFFTLLATKFSTVSPLAARTISDGNYLRASIGNTSLLVYPLAAFAGFRAASSMNFQALPPSLLFVTALMAIGIIDAMAGFLATVFFSILVITTGHVKDLHSFLTLAGIVLIGYSPGLLAGVFRPFRREVATSRDRWERATDYILGSILSGWVVKQIVSGLPGLFGLDLPISHHANSLGIIAGSFVALRFFAEDIVYHFFPQKIQELEPEYRNRTKRHAFVTAVMQILVFALVAQPFIGWKIELWIGMAIFALPIFLAMISSRFPKSEFLGWWLPSGVIEIIIVTLAGLCIASFLQSSISNPGQYILIAFVVLSIPAFILKVLPLFGNQYLSTWRESGKGNATYRILGLLVLGVLIYIIFSGILG